jgi:hypothetical protein
MIKQIIDLLNLRNELLSQIATLQSNEELNEKIRFLMLVEEKYNNLSYSTVVTAAIDQLNSIKEQNTHIIDNIRLTISQIEQDIDAIGLKLLSDSTMFDYESARYKKIQLDTASVDIVKTRIGKYSGWQYPGMIIQPKSKDVVDFVVASDPLYLVHFNFEQSQEVIADYSVEYQRRLRLYDFDEVNFVKLPQAQASIVLCWELFNFLTLDLIKELLVKGYNWLQPGGVTVASYSNCDLIETANSLKFGDICYCNPRLLEQVAVDVGFEVELFDIKTADADIPNYVSWIELRKPGTLSTSKMHQALGEIQRK